jgi:ubiquinone/menaquinone biosynthesis C-methylase UbiE
MENTRLAGDADEAVPRKQGGIDPIAFHNQQAATWEKNYQSEGFLSRLRAFDEALGGSDLKGSQWLDAGCGSGRLSRWLSDRGATVSGIDGAPEMVRVASEFAATAGYSERTQFQVANVGELPFTDGLFDGVVCSSVLEYVDDPKAVLSGFARVTKSGGTLLISVPNARSVVRRGLRASYQVTKLLGHPQPGYMAHSHHQFSIAQFTTLLREQGYEADYASVFGDSAFQWLRNHFWFGRLLIFRAKKLGGTS